MAGSDKAALRRRLRAFRFPALKEPDGVASKPLAVGPVGRGDALVFQPDTDPFDVEAVNLEQTRVADHPINRIDAFLPWSIGLERVAQSAA
ncbi:MAG: hypothetical protein VR70_13910 [Rhodospirillaceae bacterium BRH_c57]|nr:MAG: hypothetical protein VR70_13910 [Rhodospirillaceae bacterium BRH_c57]